MAQCIPPELAGAAPMVGGESVTVERVLDCTIRLAECIAPVVMHLKAAETFTGHPVSTSAATLWDALVALLEALRLNPADLSPPDMSKEDALKILQDSGAADMVIGDAAKSRTAALEWTSKMSHDQDADRRHASDAYRLGVESMPEGADKERKKARIIEEDDEDMDGS